MVWEIEEWAQRRRGLLLLLLLRALLLSPMAKVSEVVLEEKSRGCSVEQAKYRDGEASEATYHAVPSRSDCGQFEDHLIHPSDDSSTGP